MNMNNGPLLFFGILATLASSFWGLLLAPQLQIGRQQPVMLDTGEFYPPPRPGLAQQGAEVYRAQGCVECHSQQVRQTGVSFDVWLADAGTNKAILVATLTRFGVAQTEAARLVDQAPARVLKGLSLTEAQRAASQLTNDDARAQAVLVALGPDIERLWGRRGTVTQDYLRDYPVQLGNLRLGPDLANYGTRNTNINLILLHLYEPRRTMSGSIMPPYRYLFERLKLSPGQAAPDNAILVSRPTETTSGEAIVPRPEAEALAAYLTSLKADASLPEAPTGTPPSKVVPATTVTNAVAANTSPTK